MIEDLIKHVEPDPVMATNRKRSLHESYKVFRNCNFSAMAKSEVQDTLSEENLSICPPFARIEQRGLETIQHPSELNLANKRKKKRRKTQKLSEEGCLTSTNDMSIMSAVSFSDGRNSGGKVVSLGSGEISSLFVTNSSQHLLHNNSNNLSNGNPYLMTKSEVQDPILGVGSTLCPSLARTEQIGMETSQNLMQVDGASRKKRSRKSRKKKAKALQNGRQGSKHPEQGCMTSTNHTDIVSAPSLSDERSSQKVVSLGTDETNSLWATNSSQSLLHDSYKVFSNATSSVAQSEVQGTILGVDIMPDASLARIEQIGMETAQTPVEMNVLSKKKSRRRKKKSKALLISGQAEKLPEEGCVTKNMNAVYTQSHHMNIMSAQFPLDVRTEKSISLGPDATNSFPGLSHENKKVFTNANPFSMSKSEVKDIILGVDSTVCPSFSRIEEVGKEATQNSVHVNPASKKKKKIQKKKSGTLQNSSGVQTLPEESCPSIGNHMNIISTLLPSDERNSEVKGSSLGASENISFSLTNFSPPLSHENPKVFSDANSFPMNKSEETCIPLDPDATNSFPVTDSSCSLSHENQKVFSSANPFSMTNSEVQDIILGVDSTVCPTFERAELLGKEMTQNYVHVNPLSKKKKRRNRKKNSDAIKNSGKAQQLPVESCPYIRNNMNIVSTPTPSDEKISEEKGRSLGVSENNSFPLTSFSPGLSQEISKVFSDANSFPMSESEMKDGTLGVVSSKCPALAKIEGTGMETTNNSVEVNMVIKKRRRRSRNKKPNTLDNSREVQKLVEEGSRFRTDYMNTMTTDSVLHEKNSEERAISSGVYENKQLCHAVAIEENSCSEISQIPLLRAPIGLLRKKKLLILDINGLLADIVRPPPKKCKSDINIAGRASEKCLFNIFHSQGSFDFILQN